MENKIFANHIHLFNKEFSHIVGGISPNMLCQRATNKFMLHCLSDGPQRGNSYLLHLKSNLANP